MLYRQNRPGSGEYIAVRDPKSFHVIAMHGLKMPVLKAITRDALL